MWQKFSFHFKTFSFFNTLRNNLYETFNSFFKKNKKNQLYSHKWKTTKVCTFLKKDQNVMNIISCLEIASIKLVKTCNLYDYTNFNSNVNLVRKFYVVYLGVCSGYILSRLIWFKLLDSSHVFRVNMVIHFLVWEKYDLTFLFFDKKKFPDNDLFIFYISLIYSKLNRSV